VKERPRLVIDASVARAAGGENAVHPTSAHCRDFLGAVLRICNHVVFTAAALREWKKHRSRFARLWHTSMTARRKVLLVGEVIDKGLKEKVLCVATSEGRRAAVEKDYHLVDGALRTDRIVVSLDESAVEILAEACATVGEIREIMWVNPDKMPETVIEWLEKGTPVQEERKLRHRKQ
jgi:hypothetical protein